MVDESATGEVTLDQIKNEVEALAAESTPTAVSTSTDPVVAFGEALEALWQAHVPNSVFSRDTPTLNKMRDLVQQLETVAGRVQRV